MLFGLPAAAQSTTLALAGGTITFPAPTAADYIAGFVNSTTGVTFTVNATNGTSRTTTVSIRATSTFASGKTLGDLQWRRNDLIAWTPMTLTNVQVEQRVQVRNGLNDPWNNTIFFRMNLNWATDAPATYALNYRITLSQTVP
jgi:hypothetical protein